MPKPIICSTVTEYERGWGLRPDGMIVAISQEAFDRKASDLNYCGDAEEYSTVDNPKGELKLISEEDYENLFLKRESAWIGFDLKFVEL